MPACGAMAAPRPHLQPHLLMLGRRPCGYSSQLGSYLVDACSSVLVTAVTQAATALALDQCVPGASPASVKLALGTGDAAVVPVYRHSSSGRLGSFALGASCLPSAIPGLVLMGLGGRSAATTGADRWWAALVFCAGRCWQGVPVPASSCTCATALRRSRCSDRGFDDSAGDAAKQSAGSGYQRARILWS